MKAIVKCADGELTVETSENNKNTNGPSTARLPSISWKINCATQELQVKYVGNLKTHGLVIKAKSQDLKNILGTTTLIDCQNGDEKKRSKSQMTATMTTQK